MSQMVVESAPRAQSGARLIEGQRAGQRAEQRPPRLDGVRAGSAEVATRDGILINTPAWAERALL